jgi:formylmethanofuran dehydrogenase subunit C
VNDFVVLTLRQPLDHVIEIDGLTAERFVDSGEREILSLPVRAGTPRATVGDFFDMKGERSLRVRVEGDLAKVDGLGAGMTGGELVIDGDVGRRVGAGMSGGWIEVRGRAGDEGGLAMAGGTLRIQEGAGHRTGAAMPGASKGMTGGELIVNGTVGDEVGARARRGLIVVAGDTGADAARAMIAGTLVVFGNVGDHPGRGSKRGSIVACGSITVPATYAYACTYQPTYIRLLMTHLRRRYGMDVDRRLLEGKYRRYCGDLGDPGKGEILQFAGAGSP